MKKVLTALYAAMERGERAVLCAVVAAEGSAPRHAGAKMAVLADGTAIGTIGGGAVEQEAIALSRTLLDTGDTVVRNFALHPAQQDQLNMICGGTVTLMFCCLCPDDEENRRLLCRWLELEKTDGTYYLHFSQRVGERQLRILMPQELLHEPASAEAFWDGEVYLEKIERAKRVLLFGGGHVGRALVGVLAAVGFRVWVLDEREEIAKRENFPAAERVIRCSFADISAAVVVEREDYVVIMTPGHQSDYEILHQILPKDAAYVGCIGSRRKAAVVRERLAGAGFGEKEIARIHSPIGLAIGAQTPEEIAVSIAAEMIAHRANDVKE